MATQVLVSAESQVGSQPMVGAGRGGALETVRRRVELGGLLIDPVDLATAGECIYDFARSGRPHQIVTVNLDFISIAERDPQFRKTINAADLAVADGMPLVWLSRLRGQPLPERVAGVDLVAESCRIAGDLGAGVFLLGAGPGVAAAAGQQLETLYPGLRVVGTYSPAVGALSCEEDDEIVRRIRKAAPDFLFVALGAPRQDLWIGERQALLQVPVAMGVGCVLDLLAGSVKRAPRWMQHAGLEWAFRLGQEPQRLWRRYLVNDLPMLGRLLWDDEPRSADAFVGIA